MGELYAASANLSMVAEVAAQLDRQQRQQQGTLAEMATESPQNPTSTTPNDEPLRAAKARRQHSCHHFPIVAMYFVLLQLEKRRVTPDDNNNTRMVGLSSTARQDDKGASSASSENDSKDEHQCALSRGVSHGAIDGADEAADADDDEDDEEGRLEVDVTDTAPEHCTNSDTSSAVDVKDANNNAIESEKCEQNISLFDHIEPLTFTVTQDVRA